MATVDIQQGLAGPAPRVPLDELFTERTQGDAVTLWRRGARAWEARYLLHLLGLDLVVGLGAGATAFCARFGGEITDYNRGYLLLSAILPFAIIVAMAANHAYDRRYLYVGTAEYQRVIRAGVALIATAAVAAYTLNIPLARGYVVAALPLATLICVAARFGLRQALHRARARGLRLRRVIAVGHPGDVAALTVQLHRERYHGLEVVGACVPSGVPGQLDVEIPVFGSFERVAQAVNSARADTVIVLSCPELDSQALRRLAWQLEGDDIDLMVASTLMDVSRARTTIRPVDGLPLLHVEHAKLGGVPHVIKAVVDVIGALALLVGLAPMLALIAVAIRLDSPGPVLFRQVRVGKYGREFRIFKFRSMCVDAQARLDQLRARNDCDGVLFKMRADPRVTRVGRWLRRFSLDELPQLFNVVLGQMSLVGPRPPLPEEVVAYPVDLRRRLVVKPGMTGLWQVSGRADLSWEEAVRLDLRYVENWSLSLDLVIMLRTLSAVSRSAGAY